MSKLFKSVLISIPVILSLSGCTNFNTSNSFGQNDRNTSANKGFQLWNQTVLSSEHAINSSKSKIESSYNKISNFDRKMMTASWIDEVSSVIAKNETYAKAVRKTAKASSYDKIKFAQSLINYPQQMINYNGAVPAFIDGLNHIEGLDYNYRSLSNAFEDAARGRKFKTQVNNKEINSIIPDIYASKNGTPSVAEQMLTAAAIKILGLTEHPEIKTSYNNILLNTPIESCLAQAQRNSAQCKAASYDKNDLSFCMAKHAIGETSQCFSWILP